MHTTAETAQQESQTYTRNNSRRLPPQHKLVYSQYTPQLNSTEQRELSIPFSLEPCTPKVTEDMLARHVFWDKFTATYFPGGSSSIITVLPTGASLTSSANPLTGHGATKVSNTQEGWCGDTPSIYWYLALHGQWNTCTSKNRREREREFLDSHFPPEVVRWEKQLSCGKNIYQNWIAKKQTKTKTNTIIALEIISQYLVDHWVTVEIGDVQICICMQFKIWNDIELE